MKRTSHHFQVAHYTLLTYRLDQLWLPAAFWALFIIIVLFRLEPEAKFNMTRAYLGTVIPLIGGIMASYAVLDDPVLELRFTTPTRAGQLLGERLGLTLIIQIICALSFQGLALILGIDLSPLGNWGAIQLAWLIPTLVLIALGCTGSILAAQTMMGAFLTSFIWLMEVLARNWLAQNNGRYILIFMGVLMPTHPSLGMNQWTLITLTCICLGITWGLLHHQERYI
ncbi:MAG: hypothetical protein JXA33_01450 [Anaerolineae bacterium]|nr:hypothetical protein [Anaerolineae bacterium]